MRQVTKGKVLATALVLGAITAILVYSFLAKQARIAQADVQVVVAAQEIPRGTIIDAEMLRISTLPRDAMPAGAATTPEMVVGKVAKDRFGSGEPIVLEGVLPRNRLSYIVPPFMRAVTVALDPIIGVGGFLKPGDHVDVVATFSINNGTITKTVLQDVELLATGAEVVADEGPEGKGERAKTQPNATLAVMPTDAEKLILAESKGKLRLTLRRPDDISFVRTRGITGRAVIGPVPPDAPEPATYTPAVYQPPSTTLISGPPPMVGGIGPLPPPKPEKTVMVIRGTKVEETVIQE